LPHFPTGFLGLLMRLLLAWVGFLDLYCAAPALVLGFHGRTIGLRLVINAMSSTKAANDFE
jgi:hypothetical protein